MSGMVNIGGGERRGDECRTIGQNVKLAKVALLYAHQEDFVKWLPKIPWIKYFNFFY